MLTVEEIKHLIDEDTRSDRRKQAEVGQRYYEADHDIMKCRFFYYNAEGNLIEDTVRANTKISHPFFTELVDQLSAYILSFNENPIRAKETVEGLQEQLDIYFDEEFWAEIGSLIDDHYIKGYGYLYGYQNADDRLAFQCADSLNVIEVRNQETDDGCEYIIYWYVDHIDKNKREIRRIQVWSEQATWYYVQSGSNGKIEEDSSQPYNPRHHVVYTDPETGKAMGYSFGYIPFWRLDYNKKRISGLKPIKYLVDDYDVMECGLSNNLTDFDTPLYVVKGFQGDNLDELQTNLKTKKIVGVDSEGDIETRVLDVPYEARKTKAEQDETNIYRFGLGFNSNKAGDGNITNVVIQSRYTLLDMKANKVTRNLKKLLKQVIRPVLDEINDRQETDYKLSDIEFKFTRFTPTNESENIENEKIEADTQSIRTNTILNIAARISDEQILRALCEVMEWDYDVVVSQLKKQETEQNIDADLSLYQNIDTSGDDDAA